jgi:adenylate cyclase
LARKAGVDTGIARSVMQALGRPNPSRGERLFTDEDIEPVRAHKEFVEAGLPRDEMLTAARILSHGMAQTADALGQVVGNALLEPGVSSAGLGIRYVEAVGQFGPRRRSCWRSSCAPTCATAYEAPSSPSPSASRASWPTPTTSRWRSRTSSTSRAWASSRRPRPWATSRCSWRSSRSPVSSAPAKMVKTVGDAAMFVSPDVDPLLGSVIDLASCVEEKGERFPQVRVGVAFGAATDQAGDWFGPPVNLASRVTAAAKPGRILATDDVVERSDGFEWKRRRRRALAGISDRVRLYELQS